MRPISSIFFPWRSRKRTGWADRRLDDAAELADLLGRPAVNLDTPELQRFLANRRVLVTGAGGSIGSEICRQAMKFCPRRLVLLDRSEPALFAIEQELLGRWVGADVHACPADVTDAARIAAVFDAERPEVVFHAAAHKHVPLMERHPGEAVKNNVFGTQTLADAAVRFGVASFVLISTDKAVNPSSVMGATKRVAEMVLCGGQWAVGSGQKRKKFQSAASPPTAHCPPPTAFSSVRFGNVLGSSGSVVPTFRRQIDAGGPLTVTHPDMQRFFMTIPEAAGLVMQAGAIGRGGEVFVLDMGEQVKILDLAHAMLRRRGLRPGEDVPIRFTGIRPGEKLAEELGDAGPTLATGHEKIRLWQLPPIDPARLSAVLSDLRSVIDAPPDAVIAALREAVAEYAPRVLREAA